MRCSEELPVKVRLGEPIVQEKPQPGHSAEHAAVHLFWAPVRWRLAEKRPVVTVGHRFHPTVNHIIDQHIGQTRAFDQHRHGVPTMDVGQVLQILNVEQNPGFFDSINVIRLDHVHHLTETAWVIDHLWRSTDLQSTKQERDRLPPSLAASR
jgi:hypothetical protein